jgi:hypothetical protein
MARSHNQLAPETERAILSFIRAGGFAEVASEAAGVPRELFNRWRRRGEKHRAQERLRAFALAVRQAIAQARLRAEVEVYKDRPLDWLRNGPGRETANQTGWTGNARPRTDRVAGEADIFSDPRVQALFRSMLASVESYPEAHAHLAEATGRRPVEKSKKEKNRAQVTPDSAFPR